jgi:GT2 family glycosyltransferase
LGVGYSCRLLEQPAFIKTLSSTARYLLRIPSIELDKGKNPESGIFSLSMHRFLRMKTLSIVGCNFSCHRKALVAINGFNQDYEAPGIGEDSDIEWRFARAGYHTRNSKFVTPIFHLYHPRGYELSQTNLDIYGRTKAIGAFYCENGLSAYEPLNSIE